MPRNRREFLWTLGATSVMMACRRSVPLPVRPPSCAFKAPEDVLVLAGAVWKPSVDERLHKRLQELVRDVPFQAQLALMKDYLWHTSSLTISFLGTVSTNFASKVQAAASEWAPFSGIQFRFGGSGPADIRIELAEDGVNWSRYGTEATEYTQDQATVHFGSISQYSADDDIHRVVIHEFGHVLGAIHEHQSPAANISWNKPVVTDYYHNLGWSDTDIDANIFATFPAQKTLFTTFDPHSIMIYDFPSNFTTNGFSVNPNFLLSDLDKSSMKERYDNLRSHGQ